MHKLPPALVLDLSPTGIAVARILHCHGVDVYGVDVSERAIGKFSRYIKKPSFGFETDLNKKFVDNLIYFSKRFSKKVVLIPCSDVFIEFVSSHFDILNEYFYIQDSLNPDISEKFLNKRKFYSLCEELNIPYPKTLYLKGYEKSDYILQRLRLPMILKPNLIHKWKKHLKGKKVVEIKNKDELNDILKKERELLKDSMLQEIIPGPEENIYVCKCYFDKSGKLLASFTGKKIRQYPPIFGSGSYMVSCEAKEVEEISISFLTKAGFKGICGTEFKYDPRDGIFKMLEVNIRPQLWEDLTRVAGREVVWVAYCDLAGLEIPELNSQRNGAVWCFLFRDIISGIWHVSKGNGKFWKWLCSYMKKIDTDALIDFRDFPLLVRLLGYILKEIYLFKIRPNLDLIRKKDDFFPYHRR